MNEISGMELNSKSPFLWDWDNLVPKKLQLVDSEFESIEGFGINGGSGSDLGYGSSSKSTISASVDSKFTLDSSGVDFSQDPTTTPSVPDVSIVSGDSLIGLKLGKRTYFEDVSVPNSSFHTGKRSKLLASQTAEIPHCQVEGCNLDLSSAKDYHRKHRVCVTHSKCSKVVICGVERRFCQQCSRFHSLSEFDQKKRSCRKRLSDHNARRRKPKPEILQFSSISLPSPLHEGRNEISLAFNQVPMVQTRPNSNATWDFTSNSKVKQEQLGLFSPKRTQGIDNTPHITRNEPQETGFKLSYDSKQFAPSSDTINEVYHQGYQAMTATNNMNTAPELRALSLLSTNSWGSCSQEPTPPARPQPLDESSLLAIPASYWPGEAVSSSSSLQVPIIQKNGNTIPSQEFQLFKPANQSGFYAYQGLG